MSDSTKKSTQPRSPCALANSLDILGDRWTVLIIRDLMFTNRNEFGELLAAGEGISTNILSERLSRLQRAGLVDKSPHPHHGKKFIYELTEKGLALAPVMLELAQWGYQQLEGTMIFPGVMEEMQESREALLDRIYQRQPIVIFDKN